MSEVKVNKISPRTNCGTVQLGDSGDTITIPAGATITNNGTQTGFGRTGTVDWDTTAKTASFTAVSGNGYFVNTTSGAVTATLPASPSAGDIVGFNDYARNFGTNNLTIARNGSLIQGAATDATVSTNGQSLMFVYVDGTQGWIPTEDQTTGGYGALYITATGGTVTCCGDYKIHTFTGPGTFCVSCAGNALGSSTVDYLVVAGGGSGAHYAGGGGAGGYRESSGAASGCYTVSPLGCGVAALPVSVTGYPITVGGGGTGAPYSQPTAGNSGSNSVFSTITSTGGGGAGGYLAVPAPNTNPGVVGQPGGSGGGGGTPATCGSSPGNTPALGGSGNTPPVSPPQGNPGGSGDSDNAQWRSGGAGGGAGVAGSNFSPGPSGRGGAGGNGVTSSINATPTARAGGGGGGTNNNPGAIPGGTGGGGAGAGGEGSGGAGTANTGGGGGGAGGAGTSGSGGSGIVIIRYKYQ